MRPSLLNIILILCLAASALYWSYQTKMLEIEEAWLSGMLTKVVKIDRVSYNSSQPAAQELARADDPELIAIRRLIEAAPKAIDHVPNIRPEALFAVSGTLRKAYIESAVAHQRLTLAPYFKSAGLSASQMTACLQIVEKRETEWSDLQASIAQQGLNPNDERIRLQDKDSADRQEAQLAQLLGSSTYQALQEFRETVAARAHPQGLRALILTSYYTDAPLNTSQMQELAKLVTTSNMFDFTKAVRMEGGPPFQTVSEQAAQILTPVQREVFELILDSRQINLEKAGIVATRLKESGPPTR